MKHSMLIIRSICAIIIGGLLVWRPDNMTVMTVQIIGAIFVISGLVPTIGFFFPQAAGSSFRTFFPVVGIATILLGLLLILLPSQFITILMYVFGGILVLGGLQQIYAQILQRKVAPMSWLMFLLSLILLCLGFFIIMKPMESASLPFFLLGLGSIYYGVTELFRGFRLIRYEIKKARELKAQYVSFEEVKPEPTTPSENPEKTSETPQE